MKTQFILATTFLTGFVGAADRPNVLFICVDDLKPRLGCYGDTEIKTPNIDRLAKRGTLFKMAYCNQAVCAPSRNALLTGLRTSTVGIYDLGTNFRVATPDVVTLPQCFKNFGYRTEAVGKIFHVGHGNHEDPASWSVPHFPAKSVFYALPENNGTVTREAALFSNQGAASLPRGPAFEAADVADEGYPDGVIAAESVKRLQAAAAKPGEPWMLWVGFLKPHMPFCAPKKYWDLYDRSKFSLAKLDHAPAGAPAFAPTTWGEVRNYKDMPEQGPMNEGQAREMIHGYSACVSYVDAQVGKLLDALDSSPFSKNTIIVLWGDHGWHLGDHGQWSKHSNYEQATRIPLIVCGPGLPSGQETMRMTESVDIYPTLANLADIPIPDRNPPRNMLDGHSFASTLRDPMADQRESILHVFPRGDRMGRAVRTERYRLVEWKKIGEPADSAIYELYDYEKDPEETRNLASEQPVVVAKLRALLANYPEAKPQVSAGEDRDAKFTQRDKDADGKLSRDEFLDGQPDPKEARKRFESFDLDHNDSLDRKEFVTMGGTR